MYKTMKAICLLVTGGIAQVGTHCRNMSQDSNLQQTANRCYRLAILGLALTSLAGCTQEPHVLGCDSFRYGLRVVSNAGCGPFWTGCPQSFILTTEDIPDVEFYINCSNCCISQVRILGDQKEAFLKEDGITEAVIEKTIENIEDDGTLTIREYYGKEKDVEE